MQIESLLNGWKFQQQIPKWLMNVSTHTFQEHREFLKNLQIVYAMKRIEPVNDVAFHLAIAQMKQHDQNRFYEQKISDYSDDIRYLKRKLQMLEAKVANLEEPK